MKIGIAAKLSKIEWDMHRLVITREEALESYRKQEKDVGKILKSHERQRNCIESIIAENPDAETIDMIALEKGEAAKPDVDLLIVIGGDNFFQICTHYFSDAYLVGVNSDPETSHGALLNFDYESLERNLGNIVNGNFKAEEWTRVATTLNGKRLEDGSCTVSLTTGDMMCRYLLKLNNDSEEQKSSGILVVSGAGSGKRAWYRNAGIYLPQIKSGLYPETTKEFPKTSPELKTLTIIPFGGEDCTYKGLNADIYRGKELKLIYWTSSPALLSIDSMHRYDVKEGDVLTFKVSDKKLKVVRR